MTPVPTTDVTFGRTVPVLRIFDVAKAHEFYVGYLGCTVDWEHRFEPGMPLYTQLSRGNLVLHLSEHHGDGTPGGVVYTELTGVRALHAELAAKDYPYLRPGLEHDEMGWSLTLIDPFGNRLRFTEPESEPEAGPEAGPEPEPGPEPERESGPAPVRPPFTGTCG